MSDVRMIKVSEREVDIIFLALDLLARSAGDGRGATVAEVHELADDIREQFFRHDDEWGWPNPEDPDLFMDPVDFQAKHDTEDMSGRTFTVAEDDFVNAGIEAREQLKAGSRAAGRRTQRSEIERPFADSDSRTARLFRGTINPPISNDPIDW